MCDLVAFVTRCIIDVASETERGMCVSGVEITGTHCTEANSTLTVTYCSNCTNFVIFTFTSSLPITVRTLIVTVVGNNVGLTE